MKWARAVHHVETLAGACADLAGAPATIHPLRVTELWAAGDVLGAPRDLEWVTVALVIDRPVDEVPWRGEPRGAQHWANATRLAKNPIVGWWRSARAPVWNHRIVRPVLVWDEADGVRAEALAALAEGRGAAIGLAAPTGPEYAERLRAELAVSRAALVAATKHYDDKRWSPGKLDPVADELWRAADGYLDVLAATETAPATETVPAADQGTENVHKG